MEYESYYSLSALVLLVCFAAFSFLLVGAIRRFYFHPLSHFPGPIFAALSNVFSVLSLIPFGPSALGHPLPAPAVRALSVHISYRNITFILPVTDIYSPRKDIEFIKSSFYDGGNFADQAHSIVSERDPGKHTQMRKFLSRAFSEGSLREQEGIVSGLIGRWVDRVGEVSEKREQVDLTKWFNLMAFDIIGMLAFGQDFEGIGTGETHFWISDVLGSMSQASLSDTLSRFPWAGKIYLLLRPGWFRTLTLAAERHQGYTIKVTKQRINEKTDRKDFMSYLLHDRLHTDGTHVSDIQLAAHASDLVIAGSETTATTLAVCIHYLLANPSILQALTDEIIAKFDKEEDIRGTSTRGLKYLRAVCLEALRVFAPLPLGLPRVVPQGGALVDGYPVPEGFIVSTNPYAASLSPTNFSNPQEFIPERWLGKNEKDVLDATRPFSLGNRSCLGCNLAWLKMNVALSRLVWRYKIERVGPEVDWEAGSQMQLLWKKPELMVRLTPRFRGKEI